VAKREHQQCHHQVENNQLRQLTKCQWLNSSNTLNGTTKSKVERQVLEVKFLEKEAPLEKPQLEKHQKQAKNPKNDFSKSDSKYNSLSLIFLRFKFTSFQT
jgi:hypothetical protein